MNTIHSSLKEDPGDNKSSKEIQETVHSYQHEINITDGGEFLDDGIRMKDQPFCEPDTKENE